MTDQILRGRPSAFQERDIDLVLITGAGASREFGLQGKKLPLMGDWSEAIIKKLSDRSFAYLEATGLQRGMSGEQFESQLGLFLRQVEAFPLIESMLDASTKFQALDNSSLQTSGALKQWHRQAQFHLGQVVEVIRESLYEEFAESGFDSPRAAETYGRLLQAIDIGGSSSWVYVTTNYDTVGETALEGLGALPDWGQPPRTGVGGGESPLAVENILAGMPRYVPVLHLHGRVGWYRRVDPAGNVTSTYSSAVTRHQQGFGVPIVMLPDPDKVYDKDDVIAAMWLEFRSALQRAKAVLILGHSLNDRLLLDAVVSNVDPPDRVGVTLLARQDRPDEADPSAMPVVQVIQARLPTAGMITMRFGATDEDAIGRGLAGVKAWRERLEERGLL